MTRHNNLMMLFAGISKFFSSLDLALKTNFQNKVEKLAYVEEYKLTYILYNS